MSADPCPVCDVLEDGYECTVCDWSFFYDPEGVRARRDERRVVERERREP